MGGVGPAVLSGFSETVSIAGFFTAVPLLVHVQAEYYANFVPFRLWRLLLLARFCLPIIVYPWIVGRLLHHPGREPLVALGPHGRLLVLWAVAARLLAAVINLHLNVRRQTVDPVLARYHAYLAGLPGLLALGWVIA